MRSPFLLAFVTGAAVLTALPLLQRRFLAAPPPLGTLPLWRLELPDAGTVSSDDLAGKVWLLTLAPPRCESACEERLTALVAASRHLEDLRERTRLVVVRWPAGAAPAVTPSPPVAAADGLTGAPALELGGTPEALAPVLGALRAAWGAFAGTDAGATEEAFASLPAYIVVDQLGAVRGFWRDDAAGRGNAINAVRLLAKHGPRP